MVGTEVSDKMDAKGKGDSSTIEVVLDQAQEVSSQLCLLLIYKKNHRLGGLDVFWFPKLWSHDGPDLNKAIFI